MSDKIESEVIMNAIIIKINDGKLLKFIDFYNYKYATDVYVKYVLIDITSYLLFTIYKKV